jgi:V/A-type H+-transporting ATPase subunit C
MSSDLGYINARLKGMHSRMLQAKDWVELTKATSLEQLFSLLENSDYARSIEEVRNQGINLLTLDRALTLHWQALLEKLQSFIEAKPAFALKAELWHIDLLNLLYLAGFSTRGSEAPVEASPLFGTLSAQQLEDLGKTASWKEMGKLLTLWQHPLSDTVAGLPEHAVSSLPIETALAKAFFEKVRQALAGSLTSISRDLSRYWREWVDELNLRALFILQELFPAGIPAQDAFLPGGMALCWQDFQAIAVSSAGDRARQRLARIPSLRFALACKTPGELEQRLAQRRLLASHRMYRQQPLGIGVLLAYLYENETNAANLRLLGRAIVYDLDPGLVKENLLVPSLPAR